MHTRYSNAKQATESANLRKPLRKIMEDVLAVFSPSQALGDDFPQIPHRFLPAFHLLLTPHLRAARRHQWGSHAPARERDARRGRAR